jgi:hypothetical protein
MPLRSVAVVAALVWGLAAPRLVAQGDAAYLALLDAYVRGESREAATALASWPEARARTAVRSLDSQLSPARLRTVIMLHTESAFQMDDGEFHPDVARSYLRRLLEAPAPVVRLDVSVVRHGLPVRGLTAADLSGLPAQRGAGLPQSGRTFRRPDSSSSWRTRQAGDSGRRDRTPSSSACLRPRSMRCGAAIGCRFRRSLPCVQGGTP